MSNDIRYSDYFRTSMLFFGGLFGCIALANLYSVLSGGYTTGGLKYVVVVMFFALAGWTFYGAISAKTKPAIRFVGDRVYFPTGPLRKSFLVNPTLEIVKKGDVQFLRIKNADRQIVIRCKTLDAEDLKRYFNQPQPSAE